MPSQPERITSGNVGKFDPAELLSNPQALTPRINEGLRSFMARTVNEFPGDIDVETARGLVSEIAHYEIDLPLYSVHPFRYVPIPDIAENGFTRTAQNTIASASQNAHYMRERFGDVAFASQAASPRRLHRLTWLAPIDRDYHLKVRGGSGAGTFSVDFGLGVIDYGHQVPFYKELWRTGVDTAHGEQGLAARFIRTGSGVKEGKDSFKGRAFDQFYKKHGISPQRLLGLVGMYFMRELEPEHAFALTTEGARSLSTLQHSRGGCNYTKIFTSLGFQPTSDENWLAIPNFEDGFYQALETAYTRRTAEDTLNLAVEGLKTMAVIDDSDDEFGPLFEICSDDSPSVVGREFNMIHRIRAARPLGRRGRRRK